MANWVSVERLAKFKQLQDAYNVKTFLGINDEAKSAEKDSAGNVIKDVYAPLASPALTGTPTAPTAAVNTNTTQVATTAFVVAEINNKIAAAEAMIFKGTLGTAGTVQALPANPLVGWTYKVVTAGTYGGHVCELGDMIICVTGGATPAWAVVQANIDGAVTGPASATADHIATFDGTTGKVIKDSGYTIKTSVPENAVFTDHITTATTTGDGNGVTAVTADANGALTITKGLTFLTKHPDITVVADTTSTAAPGYGETFTVVDAVTRDANGHVTTLNTKTVTIPASDNTDKAAASANKAATKLFLIGAEAQSAEGQTTYSNANVYINANNQLVSNGTVVSVEGHKHVMADITDLKTTDAVTASSSDLLTSGGAYTNLVRRLSSTTATGSASQGVYVDANGQIQVTDAVTSTYVATGTAPVNGVAVAAAITALALGDASKKGVYDTTIVEGVTSTDLITAKAVSDGLVAYVQNADIVSTFSATGTAPVNGTAVAAAIASYECDEASIIALFPEE